MRNINYGKCSVCENQLSPVWFEEKEYKTSNGMMIPTGRIRLSCSHLECENCGKSHAVDDTFDLPWR